MRFEWTIQHFVNGVLNIPPHSAQDYIVSWMIHGNFAGAQKTLWSNRLNIRNRDREFAVSATNASYSNISKFAIWRCSTIELIAWMETYGHYLVSTSKLRMDETWGFTERGFIITL